MDISFLDTSVLVLYIAGVLFLGLHFGGKNQNSQKFMVAGRSLPAWVVGFSILGTYVSSISFLANPGKSYGGDWNSWVFGLSIPFAVFISAKYFIPYYRSKQEISAYSFLEVRFGGWARTYASSIYILLQLGRMGTIMYLMALPLHHLFNCPVWFVIAVMGILVTLYTLVGGIEAVIWTDVIQSIVLIIGAIAVLIVLSIKTPDGFFGIISTAYKKGKLSLGSFGPSLCKPTFWIVLMFGLFENLKNFGIDQSYIQRYATVKTEDDAKKSLYLGALSYIPISALLFLIGTALFVYYSNYNELLPENLKGLKNSDQVFPFFIVSTLPAGLKGLLIAAIFAAGMSSIDSSLNCSATLTLTDFYQKFYNKNVTEKESMRVLHWSTFLWGSAAVGIALAMIGVKSVLDIWWKISGAFGGGMLGLFLLGFISKKTKNTIAALSLCIGVFIILWMSLTPALADKWHVFDAVKSPFHGFLSIIFGTSAILISGFLLTYFFKKD